MIVITEVKTHSPFGWHSDQSWDELFELANQIGDIVSIHTDPRWHGSIELVKKARALTNKPILAKGIHSHDSDITNALEAGADWVLVVGRTPRIHLSKCMIEPNTIAELEELAKGLKAVWNSRDLNTGGLKTESFADARRMWDGWLCQASNITTIDDVDPSANAVLVGTNLSRFTQSLKSVT